MIDSDKKQFAAQMYGLGEYYGKPISTGLIKIYWQGLTQYTIAEVINAINLHMADPDAGQFMPKIADINRLLNGSKQTRAMVAWDKVFKAIKKIGPWESVCFDDPLIHRILQDMGGWIAICETKTDKDLEFRMHEFIKRYQGYILQNSIPEHPRYLIGSAESENSKDGYEYSRPVLIGHKNKAMGVLTHDDSRTENNRLIHHIN